MLVPDTNGVIMRQLLIIASTSSLTRPLWDRQTSTTSVSLNSLPVIILWSIYIQLALLLLLCLSTTSEAQCVLSSFFSINARHDRGWNNDVNDFMTLSPPHPHHLDIQGGTCLAIYPPGGSVNVSCPDINYPSHRDYTILHLLGRSWVVVLVSSTTQWLRAIEKEWMNGRTDWHNRR